MPKLIRNDNWLNSTDAEFRAWVSWIITSLTTAGLVQTADTGQINTSTVTRPAAINTDAGYAVFRMNDPLQSVAPVFLKIAFGISAAVGYPRLTVEIGSGSNGAGVLTGAVGTVFTTVNLGNSAGSTPLPAALTLAVANNWGVALAAAVIPGAVAAVGAGMGFVAQRTVDLNGNPTSEGIILHAASGIAAGPLAAGQTGVARFSQRVPSESMVALSGNDVGHHPMGLTSYAVGASPQIFPTWCALPKVQPMAFLATAPHGSSPVAGQTFPMTIVGATVRTYIGIGAVLGRQFYSSAASGNVSGHSFVMWED